MEEKKMDENMTMADFEAEIDARISSRAFGITAPFRLLRLGVARRLCSTSAQCIMRQRYMLMATSLVATSEVRHHLHSMLQSILQTARLTTS